MILRFLFLFSVVLAMGKYELVAKPGMQGVDEINAERERLQRAVEESENSFLERHPESAGDGGEYEPSKHTQIDSPFEPKEPIALEPVKVVKEISEKVGSGPVFEISYFRRMRNMYGCFVQFLREIYRVRFERDTQIVGCVQAGAGKCESEVQAEGIRESQSLGEEFKICLDRD